MLKNMYITDKDLFCCVFCNVMLSETIQITRMGSTTGTIQRPGHG